MVNPRSAVLATFVCHSVYHEALSAHKSTSTPIWAFVTGERLKRWGLLLIFLCHTTGFQHTISSKVCEGGMTSTRCSHPFRGKRSSQDFAILRPVVFGPIYLVESGGVTEQLTYLGADQPIAMHEVKLATLSSVKTSSGIVGLRFHSEIFPYYTLFFFSGSFLITAIGSGLLFIIALTVVTLACLKRKGRSKQTL